MSHEVIMPQFGETVAEGKILAWFKNEGDDLKEGDSLFEIESDKATMEVQAVANGKLTEIRVKAGDIAKVGAVVAIIGGGAKAARVTPTLAHLAETAAPAVAVERSPFEEVSTPVGTFGPAKGPLELRITPLARRLIANNGLDAEAIARTVKAAGGIRISQADVRAALAAPPPEIDTAAPFQDMKPVAPVSAPISLGGEIIQLNTIRKRTGERLTQNWQTIPHIFQAIEVDFTAIEAVRSARKGKFKTENGVSLTYLPFIARAVCLALREFPQINARFNGDTLSLSSVINLGIAVDLSHNGLVVPVIRDADDLTVPGLAKAVARQVEKARSGKLTGDDFSGGTYSISNNGSFGTLFTVPIINAPQVAILSTDAIRMRPMVIETSQGAFVAPRLTGTISQSFDHRAFDGAYSAAFLSRMKAILESRDWSSEFA